jgi:hypothetical protein
MPFQLLLKPDSTEHSPSSSKMTSDISILGVNNPEKLAHGQCPHCNARVYLWMTGDGVELSTSSLMRTVKAPPYRSATPEVTGECKSFCVNGITHHIFGNT